MITMWITVWVTWVFIESSSYPLFSSFPSDDDDDDDDCESDDGYMFM